MGKRGQTWTLCASGTPGRPAIPVRQWEAVERLLFRVGHAFLTVRFSTAAQHDDSGKSTLDTCELAPGLPSVLVMKQTGDFEAVLSWVLGLRQPADFAVHELQDPPRVVIEVAQP